MSSTSRQKTPPKKSPPEAAARQDTGRTTPPQSSRAVAAAAAAGAAAAAKQQASSQSQSFDRAIALFHTREYGKALELFTAAENGPNSGMAHSARQHARICERRLAQHALTLRTPEEHYNYAVALINERKLPEAEKHLREAIAHAPGGDHLYYALALCLALRGDLQGAHANLSRAIKLDPRNRVSARNDPDFAEVAKLSPIAELLYPESAGA